MNIKEEIKGINKMMSELSKVSKSIFGYPIHKRLNLIEGLDVNAILTKKNRIRVDALLDEEQIKDIKALFKPLQYYKDDAMETLINEGKDKYSNRDIFQELRAKQQIGSVLETANDMYYKLVETVAAILHVFPETAEGYLSQWDETRGLVKTFSEFGSKYHGSLNTNTQLLSPDISYREGVKTLNKIIEQLPEATQKVLKKLKF